MRLTNLFCALAALLVLGGCATPAPVVVKLYPPSELTQDCLHPTYAVRTNRDLADGIIAYQDALVKCNIDKASLRAWAQE